MGWKPAPTRSWKKLAKNNPRRRTILSRVISGFTSFAAVYFAIRGFCECGFLRATTRPRTVLGLYPVLYLNDGQNLFDRTIAFGGVEWQVDETADRLIRQEVIAPLIIVGIDNTQGDRMKEYLPFRSFNPPILRPLGKRFPNFLINEVMPFVEGRYRVARGPENSALGGSSLGALISLYTVIQRPGIFGGLLLESPSLFVSYRRIVKFSRLVRQWPAKIFLAIGTREAGREDKDRQVVEDVRELERTLRQAGLDDRRLRVKVDEGATHSEGEWAKRFPEALSFLFAK